MSSKDLDDEFKRIRRNTEIAKKHYLDVEARESEVKETGSMTEPNYEEYVISKSKEPSILWIPEDYGFDSPKNMPGVWYMKNLELRSLSNDFWLLRKKVKNKNNNTEMLLKWRMQILPSEKDFADVLFSKGLR